MNCFNITTWSCNILRASGIPVYFEFTPQYRDRDNPHYWCASPDSTNIPLPYTVPNNNLMDDWESELQYSSKVYRRTYGANRKTPHFTARPDESIPAELAIPTLLDVTWRYHPTITLRVPLDLFIDNNNVYLCTFNTKTELTAVAWGKVDYKKREAIFEQVPINHLFFPAYYVDEEYISFSTPFILTADSLAEIPEPFSDSKPYKPVPAVIIVEIIHVPAMFVSYVETIHVFAIYVPLVDTIHAFAVSIVAIILALVVPFAAILHAFVVPFVAIFLAHAMTGIQIQTIRTIATVLNAQNVED